MSAMELQQTIDKVITEAGIARIALISAMNRTTDMISILQGLKSNSVDVRMAIEGFNHIEQILLTGADEMESVRTDLSNYRTVI